MIRSEPLSLRVHEAELLSDTLRRVTFVSADGSALPTSMPGAHLTFTLPGDQRAFRNSYSLVNRHDDRGAYQIIVRRTPDSRGGSAYVHERLQVGDVIAATIPSSQFPIHSLARKHLLIGGGIGITPFLSFLPVVRELGQRVEMHQFGRAAEAAAFAALLAPYRDHYVHVHPSRAGVDIGAILARQPLGTHVYCCGPQMLIDAVCASAQALGWPEHSIHSESFGLVGGNPFTVRLARTKRDIAVGEHESMLEALENAGVPAASLCRGGACGECQTPVLAGKPEHRDHFLTKEEKASGRIVMPCVSRSRSALLTLDL